MAAKKAAEAPAPAETPLGELVDELGKIEHQLEPYRAAMAREDKLRLMIRARFDSSPAAEAFETAGERFAALVGARGNVSVIDNKRAFKALGAAAFQRIAKLTLAGLLRENVDTAGIVTQEQTGPRSLRIFRRIPQ